MARDDFLQRSKDSLARRVAFRCSNPACSKATAGPHTDDAKSVSVGVASHITAASPGGPRFDSLVSPDERMSVNNGIWLCQTCAKLIDSDETRYPVKLLRQWKIEAESAALRAISGNPIADYFPQPPSAQHAPIPKVAGKSYDEARPLLIDAGWQPFGYSMAHCSEPLFQFGNGLYFLEKGYYEVINCCPTGLAFCTFGYHDVYGNKLVIITEGEIDLDVGALARVRGWRFEKDA